MAGRGGLLPPMECGTYLVDEAMVEELRLARRGEHASNLGALLALRFAAAAGVNAYIVDPVTVDEWQECARVTGSPLVERVSMGHALNTKAVARRFAREQERTYERLRLVVVHMGSGITVSAHRGGRMIDNNTIDEGPFGAGPFRIAAGAGAGEALLQRQVHTRARSTARSSAMAGFSPIWARVT